MVSPFTLKKNNKILSLFGVFSVFSLLSGCDSGSGDSIKPKPAITLSGQVIKGTVIGAPVNIYRATSDGKISNTPNKQAEKEGLYTDAQGRFSISLNGNDYRNKPLMVQVGVATCSTSSSEYVEADNGCTNTDGSTVAVDEAYYVGQFRCDDPDDGCLHPETGETVAFGELVPIDFELRAVLPLLSNSSRVKTQSINVSALTTLAEQEIAPEYGEANANLVYSKIAKVFQIEGVNIVTQPMVDVSTLASSVSNTNTWLLSSVNAGVTAAASRPETGVAQTMGEGLRALTDTYRTTGTGGQLAYQYSTSNDYDLQSIFAKAQSITSDSAVSGFVSSEAKNQLTSLETGITSQPVDTVTTAKPDQDQLDAITSEIAGAKTFLFNNSDWYTETLAPGTSAYTKFDFMMSSTRAAARESIGYMETLGNDFTLVLAAALNKILDSSWNGSDFTLTSQDANSNDVQATLSKSGSQYTIEGQYLNTTFDFTFTYRESTNDEGVMPANPPQGEADDRVYRFNILEDSSSTAYAAFNEGLTLKFQDAVAVSIQVDSGFNGDESTVVRSSFAWGDVLLEQTDLAEYDQTLGRISIDGEFRFSMEHVADTIIRYDDANFTTTDVFDVPRVNDRAFVFLQFGLYSVTNPISTDFRLTVKDVGSNTGTTWPMSFVFGVRFIEDAQNELYSAEAFGSFDQDYLTNVWGQNDCDYLPVTYSLAIDQNTTDSKSFNDIAATLPDSDGEAQDFTYSLVFTNERQVLSSSVKATKDASSLCNVTYSPEGGSAFDVDYYKTNSVSETGSFDNRTAFNFGNDRFANSHGIFFSEEDDDDQAIGTANFDYDDCENTGTYSFNGLAGRIYNCSTPDVGSDDEACLNSGLYTDMDANPIIGSKIERQLNSDSEYEFVVVDENYRSCDDGEEWEVRYTDGTIQVLPFDLSVFGVPSN